MKLTKRHMTVLKYLSGYQGWCHPFSLPDGNARSGGASAATLRELGQAKLIEYGKEFKHSHYGYRITPAGRAALQSEEAGK